MHRRWATNILYAPGGKGEGGSMETEPERQWAVGVEFKASQMGSLSMCVCGEQG